MLEKITKVSNPLTVIAIFAAITEVGGTGVLPFLSQASQLRYIWFLMLFPSALVVLFFGVLWFKHRVLYAPSDFRDDQSFMAAANITVASNTSTGGNTFIVTPATGKLGIASLSPKVRP